MLNLGIHLYNGSLKITALSEGFAYPGAKYFEFQQIDRMYQWIDSFKIETKERCSWFFDENNYKKRNSAFFEFCFNGANDYFYLINHRKLQNIIQFLYEFALKTENPIMFDIDPTFILASATRLFTYQEIKSFEPEIYAF